jgi:hypothetical protein
MTCDPVLISQEAISRQRRGNDAWECRLPIKQGQETLAGLTCGLGKERENKHLPITSHYCDQDALGHADTETFLAETTRETFVWDDSMMKGGILRNKGSPECEPALANYPPLRGTRAPQRHTALQRYTNALIRL